MRHKGFLRVLTIAAIQIVPLLSVSGSSAVTPSSRLVKELSQMRTADVLSYRARINEYKADLKQELGKVRADKKSFERFRKAFRKYLKQEWKKKKRQNKQLFKNQLAHRRTQIFRRLQILEQRNPQRYEEVVAQIETWHKDIRSELNEQKDRIVRAKKRVEEQFDKRSALAKKNQQMESRARYRYELQKQLRRQAEARQNQRLTAALPTAEQNARRASQTVRPSETLTQTQRPAVQAINQPTPSQRTENENVTPQGTADG